MTADAKLMEAILVLQHKVDLLLTRTDTNSTPGGTPISPVGGPNHVCPVCKQPVLYNVDIEDSVVVRKCGCSTGKVALDMRAFAPPVLPARKTDNGGRDEEEDRSDPARSNREPRRR